MDSKEAELDDNAEEAAVADSLGHDPNLVRDHLGPGRDRDPNFRFRDQHRCRVHIDQRG